MLRHLISLFVAVTALAVIPHPDDAPKPLSPAESAKAFALPAGIKIELLASEPLIHEPSGVCWDERGRMFVCELHGYNVEGQHDIDELNKSGELDLEVRRIQASEASKKKAEAETYGTVKLVLDTDGDGVMDKAEVWADRLPPCYGLAPGNGGIIVACAPDIVFLKDTDGDNKPDVQEKLFTGFGTGALERGINAPTWGPDNWLYFGRGWNGGSITGPHLAKPVTLPATDFRIRADGSAVEPVSGSTKTIGMAFTEGGDRFVATTTHPGLFVTPIPWRYLARNPDAAAPVLDSPASDDTKVYPIAPTHPWRLKREQHAEYFAFYRKISLSDAAASGYFTSACSPLVYHDSMLPGLHGHYLVCEPAQNLVHRSEIIRDGTRLRLQRVKGEEHSEFLASRDAWFHPMSLATTPDGCVAIVDFYREIIEDYSAIPRHLQQQYGVINGRDRGRIWKLVPETKPKSASINLAALDDAALVKELSSDLSWRRRTAQRMLIEQKSPALVPELRQRMDSGDTQAMMMLSDLGELSAHDQAMRLLKMGRGMMPEASQFSLALLAGDFTDQDAGSKLLLGLARDHGDLRWMDAAIASSAHKRERAILSDLARAPSKSAPVMTNLAGIIAARGDEKEITESIAALEAASFQGKALEVLKLGLEDTKPLASKVDVPAPTAPTAEQIAGWEKRVPEVLAALKQKPDLDAGKVLFQSICAACHRSHGMGFTVGPDLDAEFQRAPEVILRDVLFPSEAARPGYETMMVKTQRGETLLGITASDSPTSLTLHLPGGVERTVLRKRADIRTIRNVSLMPAGLGDALKPDQIANIIAFLRSVPKAP
ncbi:MAG: c-type cytochrome [Verrucomicrobiaceae bacterium]|nr:c-type cytochrome [Verrucomicrobiaceae bacterium]